MNTSREIPILGGDQRLIVGLWLRLFTSVYLNPPLGVFHRESSFKLKRLGPISGSAGHRKANWKIAHLTSVPSWATLARNNMACPPFFPPRIEYFERSGLRNRDGIEPHTGSLTQLRLVELAWGETLICPATFFSFSLQSDHAHIAHARRHLTGHHRCTSLCLRCEH